MGSFAVINITIEPYTILVWVIVGLVAGFLASRVLLGHGLGLLGDIAIGIIGAIAGGLIISALGVTFNVAGHPIVSQTIVAFLGALVLLLIVRMLKPRRRFGRF